MENKINIAELLKDCPRGMELNCTMYNNLYFNQIYDDDCLYKIGCYTIVDGIRTSINFTEFGTFNTHANSKCVIFPKGKTTWKGFVPPCQFKNGDVLHIVTGEGDYSLCIVDCIIGNVLYTKASCSYNGHFLCTCEEQVNMDELVVARLATDEGKQILFDAINKDGYKWNAETKTLERLVEPKFKVGDRIKRKGDTRLTTIKDIRDNYYIITFPDLWGHAYITDKLLFSNQDKYEIIPNKFDITTLKPFEKVLVRGDVGQKWTHDFFGFIDKDKGFPFVCVGHYVIQCIPYEGNEHLLGKTDDCDDFYKTWK